MRATFQMGDGGIETKSIFERAIFLAVKGGAKTLKQVIEAAKATMGRLGNDVLSIQMNLMEAVNTGRIIERADGFAVN